MVELGRRGSNHFFSLEPAAHMRSLDPQINDSLQLSTVSLFGKSLNKPSKDNILSQRINLIIGSSSYMSSRLSL